MPTAFDHELQQPMWWCYFCLPLHQSTEPCTYVMVILYSFEKTSRKQRIPYPTLPLCRKLGITQFFVGVKHI